MRCTSPIEILNPNYEIYKNIKPNITRFMLVPCGKCKACLMSICDDWSIRLLLQSRIEDSSLFVTLTYDDDHLHDYGVDKRDLQLFHKRLRKAGFKFKYYVISEYGTHTHRPHYHGIYFGLPSYVFDEFWKLGFTDVKPVNPNAIRYVAGYHILKNEFLPDRPCNPNFKLASKGLGFDSFNKLELDNAIESSWRFIVDNDGNFHKVPRYFRKKYNVKFDPDGLFVIDPVDAKNWKSRDRINIQFKKRKFKSKQL